MYLSFLVLMFVIATICSVSWNEWQSVPWIIFLLCLSLPFCSFINHANNLGIIRSQQYTITVYEKRVTELNDTIKLMIPGAKQDNQVLLNTDYPIASVLKAVTEANAELTTARVAVGKAKVAIASRKAGPFGFIVRWYGEE